MRTTLLRALVAAGLVGGLLSPAREAASAVPSVRCVGTVAGTSSSTGIPYDYTSRCTSAHVTIGSAVGAARAGDLVLIGPGTYREEVTVGNAGHSRDGLVVRGTDRNTVRLEGDATRQRYGFLITSRDVEVANLTLSRYTHTAVFWTGTRGYHGRYLTTFNSGIYGLYAFDTSGPGLFEHSYASGHPDAGYYIGQCNPCDARISDVVAVNNGLGYSGTNASNNLVIEDSLWVANAGGILPNSLDSETMPPQCCMVIRNNTVIGSGTNPDTPVRSINAPATGFGIGLPGGMYNIVENNRVFESSRYGIVVLPFPHETPNAYRASGNVVRNNEVRDSGLYDLALAAGSGDWNCFSGNTHATSDPPAIETLYPCGISPASLRNAPVSGGAVSLVELASGLVRFGANNNWRDQPTPGNQPTMPDPLIGF